MAIGDDPIVDPEYFITLETSPLLLDHLGGPGKITHELNQARLRLGLPSRCIKFSTPLMAVESDEITIWLGSEVVLKDRVPVNKVFTLYQDGQLTHEEGSPSHPSRGLIGHWRDPSEPPFLNEMAQNIWLVSTILNQWSSHERFSWNAHEVWSKLLLGSISLQREALCAELSTFELTEAFRRLSCEGCSLAQADRLLESLIVARRDLIQGESLSERLRRGLGFNALLGARYIDELGVLYIESSHQESEEFSSQRFSDVIDEIYERSLSWRHYEGEVVVMIAAQHREQFSRATYEHSPLRVLSPQDVPVHIRLVTLEVFRV